MSTPPTVGPTATARVPTPTPQHSTPTPNGGGVQTTKYYMVNGQQVAMSKKVGDSGTETLTYLHTDHLGGTVLETDDSGTMVTDQKYYAYGKQRDSGPVSTDHQFTGQKQDGSGLMYYNARYYDPVMGRFISPDTIVPDPGLVADYNRYMYGYGNPVKFRDPSGHYNVVFDGGGSCLAAGACQKWLSKHDADIVQEQVERAVTGMASEAVGWSPAGDVNDAVAAYRGQDAITGERLTGFNRAATGAAAVIPIVSGQHLRAAIKLGGNLWSTTKKLTRVQNAFGHWRKHKDEFPNLNNVLDYVDETHKMINTPPSTALVGSRKNGDIVVYDPVSDVFAVGLADGTPKTMFIPDPAEHGYATNLDYYNANISK